MIQIRQLTKNDDTSTFDCGDVTLNQYIKQYAKQNQFKHYIGTTYIALVKGVIVGYVSVSASSLRTDALTEHLTKRLPQYPLLILRLTRFAVDNKYKQQGLGKNLLKFVLNLTLKQKEQFGCFGLVVDAKEGSVSFYEQFGFIFFNVEAGALDIRPYATSMFLSTKTIEKA
jgi:predicted N-acetyltransferase YhbS